MKRNRKFSMERLEDRQMMAGDLAVSAFANLGEITRVRDIPVVPAVPAYSSNPGAAATLYLDFDGHFEAQWGIRSNISTPVYSIDTDTTSFASYELAAIKEVWQRVSEDFAPFNINVTTVNPGDFSNGKALRVAIGGSWQDWLHEPAGGIANRNSFTSPVPNTCYAFSNNIGPARLIADTVSQEAGHSFGLAHQSVIDANGVLVEEYAPGTPAKAPLMGETKYESGRTTWFYGTSSNFDGTKYLMQDDMAIIAGANNGFGYRPDDFGSNTQDAYRMGQLSSYGPLSSISGIISKTSDADWFQFSVTTAGRMSLQANVAQVGANLDARLSLFRVEDFITPSGNVQIYLVPVATADPSTSLNASLAANVTPGNYIAIVASHGEYGDVGQYTLTGSFSQPLVINPKYVANPLLTVTLTVTPMTPTVIPPATISTYSLASSPQLLAARLPSDHSTTAVKTASNGPATSASLRAAAVDEALATRVRVKTPKLSDELFELLAAG
jgi:hypothetical protein